MNPTTKWNGKAVSIECDAKLGVFQGIIRGISENHITIARAFRNGVPLRKQNAEVTLRSQDIVDIKLLPSYNGQITVTPSVINKPTSVKQPNFANGKNLMSDDLAAALLPKFSNVCQRQTDAASPMGRSKARSKATSSLLTSKMQSMQMNCSPPSSGTSSQKCSPPLGSNDAAVAPNQSVAEFFGYLIPPKVEVRMGAALKNVKQFLWANANGKTQNSELENSTDFSSTMPIDMPIHLNDTNNNNNNNANNNSYSNYGSGGTSFSSGGCANGKQRYLKSLSAGHGNGNGIGNGYTNGKKSRNKQLRRENSTRKNQAFDHSADDPVNNGDFDFESNLALFDKQAIWNVIEAEQKFASGDKKAPPAKKTEKKYRHDENILESEPLELKQIESAFDGVKNFVTDEGLIIPTIPIFVRTKIEVRAARGGFTLQRQIDILARGAADLTLSLLGGARRFTPNNMHQWPKIVIICDESENYRTINIGAATGRTLASHGLMVMLYIEEHPSIESKNQEIALFQATGNFVTYSVDALPKPDLVILVTKKPNISHPVKKWLNVTRASIFAIDPPPGGVHDIIIKYSILPILPLNGISANNCGKLFLCNVGLPDKFFNENGIKYKSPFGHKYVIPIHYKD